MSYIYLALLFIVVLLAGGALGYLLRYFWLEKKRRKFESDARNLVAEAKKEAETIKKEAILQAKDSLFQMKAGVREGIQEKAGKNSRISRSESCKKKKTSIAKSKHSTRRKLP